jgi:hypothetical protein
MHNYRQTQTEVITKIHHFCQLIKKRLARRQFSYCDTIHYSYSDLPCTYLLINNDAFISHKNNHLLRPDH